MGFLLPLTLSSSFWLSKMDFFQKNKKKLKKRKDSSATCSLAAAHFQVQFGSLSPLATSDVVTLTATDTDYCENTL